MALARVEDFTRREVELSEFGKVLAHPARLAILMSLAKRRECICGELVLDLPLAQSTVSQHLKALKQAGLIRGEVDGPRSLYCIDWATYDRFHKVFREWSERLQSFRTENCC